MSQKETLFAWTAPGSTYPAYVNISKEGCLVTVTARGPAWLDSEEYKCGDTVTVHLPAHEADSLLALWPRSQPAQPKEPQS